MRPGLLSSPSLPRIAAGIGLLAVLIGLTTSPQELLRTAAGLDLRFAAAALVLLPLALLIQWWKWRVLLRTAAPELSDAAVLRSLLAGFGLGLITPGRLGEVGRGLVLPGRRKAATRLALCDRLLSAGVTLLSGALCAAAVIPWAGGGWLLGAAAGAGGAAGCGWFMMRRRCRPELPGRVPLRAWAANIAGAVTFNLVFFVQFHLLLLATGPLPPAVIWSVPVVFALKTLLPISFLDLGVRESAAVAVLGPAGVQAAAALQASLLLCAVNVVVPGLLGLAVLGRGRWSPVPAARLAHGP